MTDQPTDHRAAAEAFLESANEIFSDPNKDADHTEDRLDAITEALIGIGHALLAGLLEPIEREWIPPVGTCPRCGRTDHAEAAHDEAAARIAARQPEEPPEEDVSA